MAAHELAASLERAVGFLRKIIDQPERRVIRREKVPAVKKIVPFFEEHTDIIVKGGRYTEYNVPRLSDNPVRWINGGKKEVLVEEAETDMIMGNA